jgi:hypothetical protein
VLAELDLILSSRYQTGFFIYFVMQRNSEIKPIIYKEGVCVLLKERKKAGLLGTFFLFITYFYFEYKYPKEKKQLNVAYSLRKT